MWYPKTEAEACSIVTAFVEWARATGRWPGAEPDLIGIWACSEPEACRAALSDFLDQPVETPDQLRAGLAAIMPAREFPMR